MRTLTQNQIKKLQKLLGVNNIELLIAIDGNRVQTLFISERVTVPREGVEDAREGFADTLPPNCFPLVCNIGGSRLNTTICF